MRLPIPVAATVATLLALAPVLLVGGAGGPQPVRVTPITLDPGDPARTRIGRLTFTGGWALASRDRRFGGLSALTALGPGRLLALSDAAMPVLLTLPETGSPIARMLPTLDVGADPRSGKSSYDTESIARDPVSGRLWVGLERRNLIARYTPDLRLDRRRYPDAMRDWPANGGAEAMARLPDGRLLVIAETAPGVPGIRTALLFAVDPMSRPAVAPAILAYRPPPGYDPSDAAALPDGRVLVLNRRLGPTGFSAILTVIDPRAARAGQVLDGPSIAVLARPLVTDNFEGVAVSRERDGLVVYLVSDDNFLPVQRTLLLRFRLDL